MKYVISFFLVVVLPRTNWAQIPVIDPVHIAATIANGVLIDQQTKEVEDQNEHLVEVIATTLSIYNLQDKIRKDLKKSGSIKDLQWSDHAGELFAVLQISDEMEDYVENIEGFESIRDAYQNGDPVEGSFQLYDEVFGILADKVEDFPEDWVSLREELSAVGENQAAVNEMIHKKKLNTALVYNQLAEELVEKAAEMSEGVKQNGRWSMTEAERLMLLKSSSDMILKSLSLKTESDNLILETMMDATSSLNALASHERKLVMKELGEVVLEDY